MITPADIIQTVRVPNTNSVFFLGCFENRVTLYSQQVRALNLVDAILDQQLVREHGKVAIVGGGAAGITAAAALAKTAPALQKIDLFEARSDILEFQHRSSRYLHPHIYDWPGPGTDRLDAGLPILNWQAGPAGNVANWLRRQFEDIVRGSPIKLHTRAKVTGVIPFQYSQARVQLTDESHLSDVYDVVILSIGFGLERFLSGDTPSYWTPSPLAAPILTGDDEATIFVSGNGDGGLVDFMTAALNGLPHNEICDLITGLPFGLAALDELRTIEQAVWRPGATLDLFQAYHTRVLPLLPPAVLAEIGDRLRPGVRLWLHTPEPQLFKRTSALLNRVGVFVIIEADQNLNRNAIITKIGVPFDGDVPSTGPVRFAGDANFTPWRRFLRLGADSRTNLEPFQSLVDRLPDASKRPDPTFRPATPRLTDTAQRRFAAFTSLPEPSPAAAIAINAAALFDELRVDRGHAGQLLVSGTLAVEALSRIWRERRSISIDCNLPVQDVKDLVPALARLSAHAPMCVFHCEDRRRWEEVLRTLASGRALPDPHLEVNFRVEDPRVLQPAIGAVAYSPDQLSETIHTSLDKVIFDELHGALFDCLGRAAPAEMGWIIEARLKEQLWTLWRGWQAIIDPDSVTRRRFLLLLATERDSEVPEPAALVRVGPKTLRPFLLKAALFGLAFSIGSGQNMSPSPRHPGNLQTSGLTGHACGVSWIDGRDLTPAVVDRPWTTTIVLLAELRSAFRLLQSEPRLDRDDHAPALIGDPAIAERPLILGADDVFQAALEAGEQALATYLTGVLQWRAAAADSSLERA